MNMLAQPLESIAGFAAMLREHGLQVGVAEQQAMVRAALVLPPSPSFAPARIDAAWRAIACHDVRDWRRWPDLFNRYWYPQRVKGSTRVSGQTRPSRTMQQLVENMHRQLDAQNARLPQKGPGDTALQDIPSTGEAGDDGAPRARGGATQVDALHDRELSQWLPQDLAELERLAERIARQLRHQLTRRWRDEARGHRLDVRRTLRESLATGGLPLHPAWRAPRREKPRLFILVDVSRSMETHAQLFLRIARAFVTAVDARVFVFHTRLAEVTPLLRGDSTAIQEKVNAVTAGFGGGTRIATSVNDFHRVHARAQLGSRARVWVLSDGYDADEPHRLAEELACVKARGARIHWFHPSERPSSSGALHAVRERHGLIERFIRLNSLRDLAEAAQVLR